MKNIKIDLETAEQLLANVRGYFDDLNDLEIEIRIPNIVSTLSATPVDKRVAVIWVESPFDCYSVISSDLKTIEQGLETIEEAEIFIEEQGLELVHSNEFKEG